MLDAPVPFLTASANNASSFVMRSQPGATLAGLEEAMSCSRPVLLGLLAILLDGRALAADPVPGVGRACQPDADCPRRTICDTEHRRCERIRRQINLLYLAYCSADRRFTQVMGLYWHKKGEAGYRVLFPLYWSFWSQDGEAERRHRMVVPFYFDHRDGDRRTTVVPPVEVHREPGERTVRVFEQDDQDHQRNDR